MRLRRRQPVIPYDMFAMPRVQEDLKSWKVLEGIYHKGQDKAWNGKEVLAQLIEKHGGVQIEASQLEPIRNIFSVIFWGELAAWKVAAELALELKPLEARMAATAQAHDEARHFYVLHDYLDLLGYQPCELPARGAQVLHEVVGAKNLARKLMGMHLMVEPIALTLFQLVRESKLEPVLCDLLRLYEIDEARHVALGVNYLPKLMAEMAPHEIAALYAWQIKMFRMQLDGLKDIESDVRALGFSPRDVVRLGQAKQLQAGQFMLEQLDSSLPITPVFERIIEFWLEMDFPEDGQPRDLPHRLKAGLKAAVRGTAERRDAGLVMTA